MAAVGGVDPEGAVGNHPSNEIMEKINSEENGVNESRWVLQARNSSNEEGTFFSQSGRYTLLIEIF